MTWLAEKLEVRTENPNPGSTKNPSPDEQKLPYETVDQDQNLKHSSETNIWSLH